MVLAYGMSGGDENTVDIIMFAGRENQVNPCIFGVILGNDNKVRVPSCVFQIKNCGIGKVYI